MNSCTLMGRIVADPELKHTKDGIPVLSFRMAVQSSRKGEDGQYESNFFTCTAWRNTAENIHKFFKKGRMIAVEGRLENRSWTTEDGQKRTVTEIVVDRFHFTGEKRDDSVPSKSSTAPDVEEEEADPFAE